MAQFYLLSVLMNFLAGLILVYGTNQAVSASKEIQEGDSSVGKTAKKPSKKSEEKKEDKDNEPKKARVLFKDFAGIDNRNFRIVIGVLSAFVGIMKFLTVFRNDIPVIGDLLPALAGLAGGASILIEYFLGTTTEEVELPSAVQKIFIDSRKYIGIACLLAALLHFIFPQVMLL